MKKNNHYHSNSVYREVVSTRSPKRYNGFRTTIQSTMLGTAVLFSTTLQADISGTVFRDYNANGSQDLLEPGIAGINIQATDDQGTSSSTITNTEGHYSLGNLTGNQARIEFSLPNNLNFLHPSSNGRSTVEFVSTNSNDINIGFNNPSQFCQANPELVAACYTSGAQTTTADVLVGFPYNAGNDGSSTAASSYDFPVHSLKAKASDIGSTFGLAWQRSSSSLFAAAFLKRFAGFGPAGTGAIYKIDNKGVASEFLRISAGNDPHPAGTDWLSDTNSSGLVGKVSLGDLDISDDEKTLYTIDLSLRELIEIPVGLPATAPVASAIKRIAIPRPDPAECNPDDIRPFALKFHDGKLYVGLTCTAESTVDVSVAPTGDSSKLKAYIYTYTPGSGFSSSSVFDFALNYPRECIDVGTFSDCTEIAPGEWKPWIPGNWPIQFPPKSQAGFPSYPQPWLTDIEFDNGDMILGLRDRFGDQIGNQVIANPSDTARISGVSGGDVLRACRSGDGWELEQEGRCGGVTTTPEYTNHVAGSGPGNPGREYYWDDYFLAHPKDPLPGQPWHTELSSGGLLQLPGKADIAFTAFDPIPLVDNTLDGGVLWLNNTTGKRTHSYRIYDGSSNPEDSSFGKANGLGDLEALCLPAPVEVGNYIWRDNNNNGLQDAGETPLTAVSVTLACGSDQSTTTTDSRGKYLFSTNINAPFMTSGKNCTITVATTQGELVLTRSDAGNDLYDSDASATGIISFTAGGSGENNHSFDIGYASKTVTPIPQPAPNPDPTPNPIPDPAPDANPDPLPNPAPNPQPIPNSNTSAVSIPSVSTWGLIGLSGLLGLAGLFRRRQ